MSPIPFQQYSYYLLPTNELPQTQGDQGRKVWIVIQAADNKPENLDLLRRIFTAIKLDLDKDACLIFAPKDFVLTRISTPPRDKIMLVFGLKPLNLGLNLKYNPYRASVLGQVTYLFSESLAVVASRQESKKQLWTALQNLFLSE